MEQVFAYGLVRDSARPLRVSRGRRVAGRRRRLIAGGAAAVAALLLAGGVAYGGSSRTDSRVVVHAGDTLWAIVQAHYPGDDVQSRIAQVEAVNRLSGARLNPGQVLRLPTP